MPNHAGPDLPDGLSDQLLLLDRLSQALARCSRCNGLLGLIRIDLEGLEHGEVLGEGGCRRLLQEIAACLRTLVRASDTIARLESGGLALILPDLSDQDAAGIVASKIAALFEDGFRIDGHTLQLQASVGIAVSPANGDSPAQLLRNAAAAAAQAKAKGVRSHWFAGTIKPAHDRRHLARDLGRAIDEGCLRLEYQPQIDLRRQQPIGFEALLRWHHPALGEIDPETFVAVAEANGQIGRIGKWALVQACAAAASWPDGPLGPLRVAVNFSAAQMAGDDLPRVVARALEGAGLLAARLELELTERSVLDKERVLGALTQLRAMGVRLALDDFGMGFASLRHLGYLPLDTLKVDRSFVAGLASTQGHAIVQCVIELAHRMGLRVIAEGVESEGQLAILRELGCDAVQGHALGKPLVVAEIVPWLIAQGRA